MLNSSTIHIMCNTLLKAAKGLRRDFNELEKIQNSNIVTNSFVDNSIKNMRENISFDLLKARPEWKIEFINENLVENIKIEENGFIINPISGLKNYSNGISYFASSIALLVKGEVVASVIYDPIKDELFIAEKGKGAFMNNIRMRVSSSNRIKNSLIVLDNIGILRCFSNKYKNILELADVKVFGSNSLDLANMASGKIDCYLTKDLNNESCIAGLFLVRESGGITIDLFNEKISIVTNNGLVDNFR